MAADIPIPVVCYDVECLKNVFMVAGFQKGVELCGRPATDIADVWFAVNPKTLPEADVSRKDPAFPAFARTVAARIREKNPAFKGGVRLHNLNDPDPASLQAAVSSLAETLSVSDAGSDFASQCLPRARRGFPPVDLLPPIDNPKNSSDPRSFSTIPSRFRLAHDTDVDGCFAGQTGRQVQTRTFDPERDPYLLGYNSLAYDTTILALYFTNASPSSLAEYDPDSFSWKRVEPSLMRDYNDALFALEKTGGSMASALSMSWDATDKAFRRRSFRDEERCDLDPLDRPFAIRKNMLMTGRHIDVARLNEKQYRTGLKRLLGMLGLQILESDAVRSRDDIASLDDFLELVAYNVSDVVNLEALFAHPAYRTQFENKRKLLDTYKDVVYDKLPDAYAPDVSPFSVRRDRLFPDTPSAQFAMLILCPWGHLDDYLCVSFDYPSEAAAEKYGIRRRNILNECMAFIKGLYGEGSEPVREFQPIFDYYRSIEGQNFNDSKAYLSRYQDKALPVSSLASVPKGPSCMHYYDAEGRRTSCYVNFSTGGIHGAELDLAAYGKDLAAWEAQRDLVLWAKSLYPDVVGQEPGAVRCRKDRAFLGPDGVSHDAKEVVRGPRIAASVWKDPASAMPSLFEAARGKAEGSTRPKGRYATTSAALANHEDFSSYYPYLLMLMGAFDNPELPENRYKQIYDNKQGFGVFEKDRSLPESERYAYHLMREGTKLILNAATGKADSAAFHNPIQMNNKIISMRIIGQLFSWRIGQAQAYEGARVVSTNTDGLYTVMDETENNRILERESATIGVTIEPESLYLVSKDANNRLELDAETLEVKSASGASLACWAGPTPTKALAHPAVLDTITVAYLKRCLDAASPASFDKPFDLAESQAILADILASDDSARLLTLFANVVASSPGTWSYVYGIRELDDVPVALQHYNRVFYLRAATDATYRLRKASAKVVTDAVRKKRLRETEASPGSIVKAFRHDPEALAILTANGLDQASIEAIHDKGKDREAASSLMPGVPEDAHCLIENRDLFCGLTEAERQLILSSLDLDLYLRLAAKSFDDNWMRRRA